MSSQTAGTPFNVQITAQDLSNNTVTGFGGTALITSTGALSGTTVTSGSFSGGIIEKAAGDGGIEPVCPILPTAGDAGSNF